MLVAVMVLGVLFMGSPDRLQQTDTAMAFSRGQDGAAAVDKFSAADIAAHIAVEADMLVAESVQNKARTQRLALEFSGTDGTSIIKPQIVETEDSTEITTYTVKEGDTLTSIARRFNITTDTIKWENDIIGSDVTTGTKLRILPVSGVTHVVSEGDTIEKLAERYNASANMITAFNDAELSGLQSGDTVIIPGGKQSEVSLFNIVTYGGFASYDYALLPTPAYQPNSYIVGYCTWWADYRATQLGNPIPPHLGDAYQWSYSAGNKARNVNTILSNGIKVPVGAVAQTPRMSALGHVAVVEAVSGDGKMIKYSDMNGLAGWGRPGITTEWVPITEFDNYIW